MIKTLLPFIFTALVCAPAAATVVEIRTNQGNISVNLFDETTPETVENFLEYVNSGAYANNVVHRSEPGFVIQAGGFSYNNELPLDTVPTGTPVVNEPELSNVRGTIAMAKLAGDPDSATSQWFINIADNSANLDVQNGGFTVFGQVLADGMDVVDAINALPRYNLGGAANAIPLIDYDSASNEDPNEENFVLISDIVVTDSATVTNPDLQPAPNTLINNSGGGNETPDTPNDNGSSGGGSVNPVGLLLLAIAGVFLRRRAGSSGYCRGSALCP